MELVILVYNLTKEFPKDEIFGLTRQLRRSTISIASNIAEGCGRRTEKEFRHFLSISLGSSYEAETQLLISKEVGMSGDPDLSKCLEKLNSLQRSINAFMGKVKNFQ